MGDDKLQEILDKAAHNRKFCKLLFKNREKALSDSDLSEAEKDVLMSATDTQLNKMINQRRSWLTREIIPSYGKSGGCATATALGAGLGFLLLSSTTLGATGRVPEEVYAHNVLKQIGLTQKMYKQEYGCYADLETLEKFGNYQDMLESSRYTIEIILKENSFIAIARHRKRPKTRSKFELGPDNKIKRIDPETSE